MSPVSFKTNHSNPMVWGSSHNRVRKRHCPWWLLRGTGLSLYFDFSPIINDCAFTYVMTLDNGKNTKPRKPQPSFTYKWIRVTDKVKYSPYMSDTRWPRGCYGSICSTGVLWSRSSTQDGQPHDQNIQTPSYAPHDWERAGGRRAVGVTRGDVDSRWAWRIVLTLLSFVELLGHTEKILEMTLKLLLTLPSDQRLISLSQLCWGRCDNVCLLLTEYAYLY